MHSVHGEDVVEDGWQGEAWVLVEWKMGKSEKVMTGKSRFDLAAVDMENGNKVSSNWAWRET